MKKFFENDRLRAGVMLILWCVFILVILILFSCSPKKTKTVDESIVKDINIESKIESLLSNPINYKISSTINNVKESYDVTYEDNEYEGYYQNENETFKFKCNKTKCYKLYIDHDEELNESILKNELDIFKLKNIADKFTKEDDYYTYSIEDKTYNIYLENDNIIRITVNTNHSDIIFNINYNS